MGLGGRRLRVIRGLGGRSARARRLEGTTTLEERELVSSYLRGWKVPHSLLDVRLQYAAREDDTIAQAGRMGAVTIATNMANGFGFGSGSEGLYWIV